MSVRRNVPHQANTPSQPRRKGLKAVLPAEDNGSFASLLKAFGKQKVAPEEDAQDTKI